MSNRAKYSIYISILAVGCYFMYNLAERTFIDQNTPTDNGIAQVIERTGAGQPKIGGPFELVDHKGIKRTEADYRGKFMLVYFGYTFCPDICPTALYNLTEALNIIGDKSKKTNTIFITIDPERDNPSQLALYKENFHPSIKMLTGSIDQVKKAAKAYRVYYAKAKPDGTATEYLVDHSSIIYLMDRQGRYLTSFNHETAPEVMAKKISKFL